MGFLNGVFGRVDPQKIINGLGGFIDESTESKEEVRKSIVNHYNQSLQESTPRSLTRRYIAVSIIGVYLLFLIVAVFAYPFSVDYATFVLKVAGLLTSLVVTIAIFYFGGYYGKKLLQTRRERKIEYLKDKKDLKDKR